MDWVTIRKEGKRYFDKYKFLLLVLALGIFLMSFPGDSGEKEPEKGEITVSEERNLEERLQEILASIQGVGEVRVLLTEASGEEYFYQTDEKLGSDGTAVSRDTVIIRDENRGETGLIREVLAPAYQGALVVCHGGDQAAVRLSVIEAVANVTGIPSSRISVLKMK